MVYALVSVLRCTAAAVAAQVLSPGSYEKVNQLAAAMHQELHMIRLAITASTAVAEVQNVHNSNSSCSSRCEVSLCYLLPTKWPSAKQLHNLSSRLTDALYQTVVFSEKLSIKAKKKKMSKAQTAKSQITMYFSLDIVSQAQVIWDLLSWYRLLQLDGSSYHHCCCRHWPGSRSSLNSSSSSRSWSSYLWIMSLMQRRSSCLRMPQMYTSTCSNRSGALNAW